MDQILNCNQTTSPYRFQLSFYTDETTDKQNKWKDTPKFTLYEYKRFPATTSFLLHLNEVLLYILETETLKKGCLFQALKATSAFKEKRWSPGLPDSASSTPTVHKLSELNQIRSGEVVFNSGMTNS